MAKRSILVRSDDTTSSRDLVLILADLMNHLSLSLSLVMLICVKTKLCLFV